ncbi:hypothetical protein Tcan_05346 [Toxocara canis]|uniref:Uncharacterized protein n=1 Tax=Toxocara canis TaxID=6265 RepID=A0A0B2W155_TOXCA|nr:hypothetical protein Tcan_05346 [Toxocara canis]
MCCCTPTQNCQPCGSSGGDVQPQSSGYTSAQYAHAPSYGAPSHSTASGQYQPLKPGYSQAIPTSYEGTPRGRYSQIAPTSYERGQSGPYSGALPSYRGPKKFQAASEVSQVVEEDGMPAAAAAATLTHVVDDPEMDETSARKEISDEHEVAEAITGRKSSQRRDEMESEEPVTSLRPSAPNARKYPFQAKIDADDEAEMVNRDEAFERGEERSKLEQPRVITLRRYRTKHLRRKSI